MSDLSAGRVVNGGDFYTFDTNVLVIIGTDWIGEVPSVIYDAGRYRKPLTIGVTHG